MPADRSQVVEPTFSDPEQQAQHEKNLRILKLIRDDPAWALSRILLLEQVEAERDRYREALERAASLVPNFVPVQRILKVALHPQEGDTDG